MTNRRTLEGVRALLVVALVACNSQDKSKVEAPPAIPAQRPIQAPAPERLPVMTAKSAPGAGDMITMLRPLIANVARGDALGLALHWEPSGGPTKTVNHDFSVDWPATLESMRFQITTPSGAEHKVSAAVVDEVKKRYAYGLYYDPTLIVLLDHDGLTTTRQLRGTWTGSVPSLKSVGVYTIAASGKLLSTKGQSIEFRSEPIKIAVGGEKLAKREELLAAARKEVDRKVEPDPEGAGAGTESGFVPNLVIENGDGDRIVRFARRGKAFRWGYDLYSVKLSASGDVLSMAKQSIGTCIALGTKIKTPTGEVEVETLKPGDELVAYDEAAKRWTTTRLISMRPSVAQSTFIVEHKQPSSAGQESGASGLRATGTHPVWRDGAWFRVGALAGLAQIREPITVFELDVEPPNTYVANGVLSHNKDRGYWPALDDSWYFMWEPEALKR